MAGDQQLTEQMPDEPYRVLRALTGPRAVDGPESASGTLRTVQRRPSRPANVDSATSPAPATALSFVDLEPDAVAVLQGWLHPEEPVGSLVDVATPILAATEALSPQAQSIIAVDSG